MTDRLSALLHEEAERLHVPMPAARETLAAGRRVRRRRRVTQGLTAAVVVAAMGVGSAFLARGDGGAAPDDGHVADPAADGALGPAFASGDTVYLDGGATAVTLDEVAQTIYYTSAGYLVRTNATGNSDGGAPFHFVLLRPDGTTTKLGLTLGEVVPSTDADQPYLAYAETDNGRIEVVVMDVTTGEEVARVPVTGQMTWGGWSAPPVALDGDQIYVGTDGATAVVDWRTGEVSTTDRVGPGYPTVVGGRSLTSTDGRLRILDVGTGDVLFESDGEGFPWGQISPDGRFATIQDQMSDNPTLEVYTLDTESHITVAGPAPQLGWTPDGTLFGVSEQGLSMCSATTGRCTTTPLPTGVHLAGFVPLSGTPNES